MFTLVESTLVLIVMVPLKSVSIGLPSGASLRVSIFRVFARKVEAASLIYPVPLSELRSSSETPVRDSFPLCSILESAVNLLLMGIRRLL